MSNKLKKAFMGADRQGYIFYCPGCEQDHMFVTKDEKPPVWAFNGNMVRPTFNPSLLLRREGHTCHLFVRDGRIEYLPDCTHELKSKVVSMPDVEE